ncbi:MAG: M23 family metallopeptidase [Bacteroidetes bacterium]|nr:M23 family metallopeptidase [Bacteroidota bacterium]MDA1119410.1 M23 family metallopeptidase [Bacteroidota bacterium]
MLGKGKWILISALLLAFTMPSDDIYNQKGYYMFPIRPGEINYISGSMGELRATHFHTGIDIKTGGVEGYKVFTAADGFLSRVKVSTGGYGKSMYLQHPNNTFTVYAHLREFKKDVADWVRQQQYKKKSYEVDLFPQKDQFPVTKGELLAASGNTGSSSAPHLHFEIRDQNHIALNPLEFGFEEIKDNRPPEISAIAFRSMDLDSRVNDKFGRFEVNVKNVDGVYQLAKPINLKGRIGIELYAYDRFDETNNRYGIPCLEFYHNEELIFTHNIKSLSFNEGRKILVHTNYENMIENGRRYNKMYVDDGNDLSFYKTNATLGIIDIDDSESHHFKTRMTDTYGNTTEWEFQTNAVVSVGRLDQSWNGVNHHVSGNSLEIRKKAQDTVSNHLTLFTNRLGYELEPYLTEKNWEYYLWDLRDGLPDSIDFCGSVETMAFKAMVPSSVEFSYFSNDFDLEFKKNTLFDTLYLKARKSIDSLKNRELFEFNHLMDPFKSNVKVTLKPSMKYPNKAKTSVYSIDNGGKLGYFGGEWVADQLAFLTRDLVNFTIDIDSIPPIVNTIAINEAQLRFIIDDEMSGIKSYEVTVNGDWVLMNYDSKKKLIWSEKLNPDIPFNGQLKLKVEDQVGNEIIYEQTI